jgi:hypothetical protein
MNDLWIYLHYFMSNGIRSLVQGSLAPLFIYFSGISMKTHIPVQNALGLTFFSRGKGCARVSFHPPLSLPRGVLGKPPPPIR